MTGVIVWLILSRCPRSAIAGRKGEKILKIKLDPGAYMPIRAHNTDAGMDLRAMHAAMIGPHGNAVIHTGVHVQLPEGTAGLLVSKSGLNVNQDITSTGLIDQGYTGEILVKLYNHGNKCISIAEGQRITQLVVIPVLYEPVKVVDKISGGDRGDDGFGSTGI